LESQFWGNTAATAKKGSGYNSAIARFTVQAAGEAQLCD
jgi:hypothetical protein